MFKKTWIFTFLILALFGFKTTAAQIPTNQEFFIGKVSDINSETEIEDFGEKQQIQNVTLSIVFGSEKGKTITLDHGKTFTLTNNQKVSQGEYVIIVKITDDTQIEYFISDKLRLVALATIFLIFFILVMLFSNVQGIGSFFGLGISLAVLVLFIVPQIAAGQNPLFITLIGVSVISISSMYLAHGVNIRTTLSLISMLITLVISGTLAIIFVQASKLFGTGSEEAYFVQIGFSGKVNLQGLLLAGIILGASGVLDDITTAQTAVIDELKKANKSLSIWELYTRGTSVGKEHIASLVNTLVLAYAGASMPLFLLFSVVKDKPLWVVLNSENIAEEIVRTLVGSVALVLAVPISTLLAAWYFAKFPSKVKGQEHHHYGHIH